MPVWSRSHQQLELVHMLAVTPVSPGGAVAIKTVEHARPLALPFERRQLSDHARPGGAAHACGRGRVFKVWVARRCSGMHQCSKQASKPET